MNLTYIQPRNVKNNNCPLMTQHQICRQNENFSVLIKMQTERSGQSKN